MRTMHYLLYPLSIIYGLIMLVRNLLFDLGILHSKSYGISLVSVGNLSMGGTGKTPHIEYIIRLLKDKYFVAVLSRGYGRESRGFITASKKSGVKYIGDEPMQIVRKFDNIRVAVDEKRTRGVELLMEKNPGLEVILLDDAFQHRWVKPGFSILLSDYYHFYLDDHVFPAGRLREFKKGARRADCIVVTKTPKVFSPITRRRIITEIKPHPGQHVLFSYIRYGDPISLQDHTNPDLQQKYSFILLFTGIADNELLKEHLRRMCNDLTTLEFRDHHPYTEEDLKKIMNRFDDLPTQKKMLITTEKDAMRLRTAELTQTLKSMPIYYIPIEIDFHGDDKTMFDKIIYDYVAENKRNR
jgi:tetraacyldisaccharide 4'-kinase